MPIYYLSGYVRIEAKSDAEADRKFNDAGLGPEAPIADGVALCFEGEWDEIVEDHTCICPSDLTTRGGFRSGCPIHS